MKKNILITALVLSNIIFCTVAHVQKGKADELRMLVAKHRKEAEMFLKMSRQARLEAEKQRELAEKNAQMAFEQLNLAKAQAKRPGK